MARKLVANVTAQQYKNVFSMKFGALKRTHINVVKLLSIIICA